MTETARWTYFYSDGVERANWRGNHFRGLRPHFHREMQISHVIQGCRSFQIGEAWVPVAKGECLIIPNGVPHQALPQTTAFVCKNTYIRPEPWMRSTVDARVVTGAFDSGTASAGDLVYRLLQYGRCVLTGTRAFENLPETTTISDAAYGAGVSREHYSRQFKSIFGISPKNASLATRLNLARDLLRRGVRPAAAAHDAGFADQSHMSRYFVAFFGTTPGVYADSLPQNA